MLSVEKGVVVGAYVSVERVRRLPLTKGAEAGGMSGERGRIEWLMATASDARGILPMWVQTRAVPGQIAKDVSLFLGWMNTERRKKEQKNDNNKEKEERGGEGEEKGAKKDEEVGVVVGGNQGEGKEGVEEAAAAAGKGDDVQGGNNGQGAAAS